VRGLLVPLAAAALLFGCSGTENPGASCPTADRPGPALLSGRTYLLSVNGLSEDWGAYRPTEGAPVPIGGRGLAGRAPNDVDLVGDRLYIVNSLDNTIQEIDAATGQTVACIEIGPGANPWAFAVDPVDSSRAWVTTFLGGDVVELDLAARRVLRRRKVGPAMEGLLVTPDHIAVTLTGFEGSEGRFGQGEVVVLNRATLEIVARLPVPTNPQDLARGADGRIHVVCTGNFGNAEPAVWGSVVRIETDWSAVRDTLTLGGTPARIAVAENGTAFVAAFFGGLLAYDTATFTLYADASAPLEGSPGYSAVAVSGNRAYAANFDLDAILVLDATARTPLGDVLTGDGPVALAIGAPLAP